MLQKLELMRNQYDQFIFKGSSDTIVENIIGNLRIDSAKWIIKKHNICIWVDSSR